MVQELHFFKWDNKAVRQVAKNLSAELDSAAGFKVGNGRGTRSLLHDRLAQGRKTTV